MPNPKTPPPGPSGILTPEETPAKRPNLEGSSSNMAGVHNPNEMQMAPASNPGAQGTAVQAMDTTAVDSSGENNSTAATGQGQTGAGHALTQILRAPGYPTGDDTTVLKIRHRIPIQLEPEVPRNFFYSNPSIDGTGPSQTYLFSGWLAIPVSSICLYMNDKEITRMYHHYQAYRYLAAGAKMSNFQTHSVLPTGQDTPGFALNNSGVTFYSVQLSSRDINYPWLLGSQQYPTAQRSYYNNVGMSQVPAAFDDGDGTTRSPEFNLRPRNIMPTSWWLWWLCRVDVAQAGSGFVAETASAVEQINGFSVIPDLQRLALEQQNSPAHAAWFHRFNPNKQWRSRVLMSQAPNQFFLNLAKNTSMKANAIFTNMRFITRDVNVPFRATEPSLATSANPVYVNNYGMMVSGMQARGPPTWSSFYERIFNIDDVPMQKYGSADTYADRNSGPAMAQSKYAMNGQGYGIKNIKDLWAIAWRVPNDPSGTPVPLTIEFVMETMIDVECKHFDAQTDLNGIICRPSENFAENVPVDTNSIGVEDYAEYLRLRGFNFGFLQGGANDGCMISRDDSTRPNNWMRPATSFSQHIALESENIMNRLDGCVNPGGLTNYGPGYEGQNIINRSGYTIKSLIDISNNNNNLHNLAKQYYGNAALHPCP